jgi:hypothetical protein
MGHCSTADCKGRRAGSRRADGPAHWIDGTPVDPETSRRIEERADRITEEIRRTRGVMDDARFQALLHDDDDAAIASTWLWLSARGVR